MIGSKELANSVKQSADMLIYLIVKGCNNKFIYLEFLCTNI